MFIITLMQHHIIIIHWYNQYTVDCCFIATESFTFLLLDSIDWFKYRLDLVCQNFLQDRRVQDVHVIDM